MHRLPTMISRPLLVIAAAGTLIAIGPNHALADPPTHPSDYLAQTREPARSPERSAPGTGLLVDDWFRDPSTVVHARRSSASSRTALRVDDWFRDPSNPVRTRRPSASLGTTMAVDDWFRDPS